MLYKQNKKRSINLIINKKIMLKKTDKKIINLKK
jgi:hypothetical protein